MFLTYSDLRNFTDSKLRDLRESNLNKIKTYSIIDEHDMLWMQIKLIDKIIAKRLGLPISRRSNYPPFLKEEISSLRNR